MTTTPLGTVQGLASNIQWQDLITQIIAGETTQKLQPTSDKITSDNSAKTAWSTYQTLASKVQDAAKTLRDSAFDTMKSFVATDPSGRPLASVTATSAAVPGTYHTEIVSLASADKLGGGIVSSATANLHLSGEFFVNGTRVTVADGDTLNSIRDKINVVSTGTSGTGVSAAVLTVGSSSNRMTLTASQNGAGGIQLADGATGVLASLGLVPPAGAQTATATGGARSYRFRDGATPIGTLLGATSLPAATTIDVGNTTISVDLSTDTLDSIRAKIAATGVSASISTVSFNGTTMSQLDAGAPIGAVPGDANSQRIVDLLGFTNTRAAVSQTLADGNAWTATGGGAATATTALSDIHVGAAPVGLVAGDTITLAGMRGDGVAVATSITLDGSETVQTLLDKINASGAWGATARGATATIAADGTITLADSTAGASQLSMSMIVTKAAGGTATLGQMTTQTAGYDREIGKGSDAQIRVDGTLITRSSNTISDAIPGATFSLIAAQPGTTADVTIARDTSAAVAAVQTLATNYNALASFVKAQTAANGQLPFDNSIRASLRSLTDNLAGTIPGLSGTYTRAGTVGVTLDKTGQLQVDTTKLTNALSSSLSDVKALFGVTATTSDGLTYLSDTAKSSTGTFAVNITAASTVATLTGSGFSGTYADSGSPDGITIVDGATLASGHVSLATGDTIATIVDKFNSAFTSQNMQLVASNVGGQLVITTKSYGSAAKFNIGFDSGTNPTTQLGISIGQSAGTDVTGTIDGVAATGSGQILTGATGSHADGIAVKYAGTSIYTGQVVHTVGLAALMANVADSVTRTGDGLVASVTTSLQKQIDSLTSRSTQIQARIDAHKTALTQQFTKMESAIARLQTQTTALTSQITSLQAQNK